MEKILLTFNEAAILGAFGVCTEASFPELAVAARLTPSEVREGVNLLRNKSLVEIFNRGRYVRLTPKGEAARLNWQFDPQGRPDSRLYNLPPGQTLDSAIDAEIEKLGGN